MFCAAEATFVPVLITFCLLPARAAVVVAERPRDALDDVTVGVAALREDTVFVVVATRDVRPDVALGLVIELVDAEVRADARAVGRVVVALYAYVPLNKNTNINNSCFILCKSLDGYR